jgi:hypothetical protein
VAEPSNQQRAPGRRPPPLSSVTPAAGAHLCRPLTRTPPPFSSRVRHTHPPLLNHFSSLPVVLALLLRAFLPSHLFPLWSFPFYSTLRHRHTDAQTTRACAATCTPARASNGSQPNHGCYSPSNAIGAVLLEFGRNHDRHLWSLWFLAELLCPCSGKVHLRKHCPAS